MKGVELLNRRVLTSGIELGRVVDVILDETGDREIGLDVRCKDGVHRVLPIASVDLGEVVVVIESRDLLVE